MRPHACPRRWSRPWNGIRKLIAIAMIAQQITALPVSAGLNVSGRWVSSPDLGFSGTHVAVLRKPGTDTTTVFMFGESGAPQMMKFWRFAPGDTNLRWPTLANTLNLPHPNNLESDLFCSGHATLPDGKLLLVGGTWQPEPVCQHVYSLDPGWNPSPSDVTPWEQNAIMAVERWYATATPLSDGKVLAAAGTMATVTTGFGGLFRTDAGDTTYDRVHPLEQAGRYAWSDTTTIPANAVGFGHPTIWHDDYTNGKWPRGREGHGFVADGAGRGILVFGRSIGPVSGVQLLDDVWSLRGSKVGADTLRAWDRFEPVGDPSLPAGQQFPVPRHRFAMTWAGVENKVEGKLPNALEKQICFIHGGLDAANNVLGDLWKGERRLDAQGGTHYEWVWTRLLSDAPSRRRFGHTMMFDPGPWAEEAPYAELVMYGGQTAVSPPAFANTTKLYVFGVGSLTSGGTDWQEISPGADPEYGYPPAVEGHAMTAIFRGNHVTGREYYMFGGQDASGNLVPPDLWYLERPDTIPSNLNQYSWEMLPNPGNGPTARTRAAMAFNVDGSSITVIGGDTTGSAVPGGFSNAVWTHPVTEYGGEHWRTPPMRSFHSPPPGVAGMPFLTAPEGAARITRSLERFRADASSGAGLDCPALPGQWETVTLQNDADSERPIADYPYMFQLPDGRMFNAGPVPYSNIATRYKRFFDFSTRRWTDASGDNQDAIQFGSAVMYRPGKLLRAGAFSSDASNASYRTETVSISPGGVEPWIEEIAAQPKWRLGDRKNHNLTLLPTGDVLATGGHGQAGLDASIREPKMWSVALNRWNSDVLLDGERLAFDPRNRNYHSTAILLPDARVMTAGGEGHVGENLDQTTASIFEPGYLFRSNGDYAVRPRVLKAPAVLTYGRTFTLTLTDEARTTHIKSIALMRPGAVTHSFDQNQRYVPLSFTLASNPTRLLVQAPADAYIAPPGDQMLFILDSLGTDARRVPSIARWTRTENQSLGLDSADVLPPGKVVDLEGCPHADQLSGELAWTEPADDWGLAASGRAVSYDLRYKVGTASPDTLDWDTGWTPATVTSPVTPGDPGGLVTVQVVGLSPETKHWFRVKTLDDNNHWSALSNAAMIWTREGWECAGGSFAGGGGGGGYSVERVAGVHSLRGPAAGGSFENSFLDAGPVGTVMSDALRLPAPFSTGTQRLWFRTRSGFGMGVDRARLLVAERPENEEAYVTGSSVLVGTALPIAGASLGDGRTFDGLLRSVDGGALLVLPGDTLDVDLGTSAGSALIVEGRSTGGRGASEGMGFVALVTDGSGNETEAGRASLRDRTDRVAIEGLTDTRVRLAFNDGAEITGLKSLVLSGGQRPLVAIAPTSATNSWTSDATALTQSLDGLSAWLVDHDTLHFAFTLPVAPEGKAVDVFLELTGGPVSPRVAQANRGRRAFDQPAASDLRFMLMAPQPNPSTRTTTIGFTLPEPSVARLTIFDAQGRRIREFVARYEAGRHLVEWDLRTGQGRRVAPGIYTCRLRAGRLESNRRLAVLP